MFKQLIKKIIPKKILQAFINFRDSHYKIKPKKIIEHMEVDFALSRVFNKLNLKVLDIGSHYG
jgi:hypothetical protein